MSEINSLAKDIPPTQHTFQLDVVGKVTKKRFLGDFTCHVPNVKEQCLIEKHEAFLNGEMVEKLSAGVRKTHQMIAYLRYTLDVNKCPNFWRESDLGYELRDLNVIQKIYNEVLDFEERWIKEIWGDETQA